MKFITSLTVLAIAATSADALAFTPKPSEQVTALNSPFIPVKSPPQVRATGGSMTDTQYERLDPDSAYSAPSFTKPTSVDYSNYNVNPSPRKFQGTGGTLSETSYDRIDPDSCY